jgi:hypothetical protein
LPFSWELGFAAFVISLLRKGLEYFFIAFTENRNDGKNKVKICGGDLYVWESQFKTE